jgi:golgin subfamily A member 4
LLKERIQFSKEVKELTDKCTEHQEQAHSVQQRSLELEDLLDTSKTHAEGAYSRTQELEQELNSTYEKLKGIEEELEQYISKASQLSEQHIKKLKLNWIHQHIRPHHLITV